MFLRDYQMVELRHRLYDQAALLPELTTGIIISLALEKCKKNNIRREVNDSNKSLYR